MSKSFDEVVRKAQDAFWEVVANENPHVKSGDMEPLQNMRFNTACKEVVKSWLLGNTSTHEFEQAVPDKEWSVSEDGTGEVMVMFNFNDLVITDPFLSENTINQVDPVSYYGIPREIAELMAKFNKIDISFYESANLSPK